MKEVPPETPVLVGVAAVMQRNEEPGAGKEASALMIDALELAARDAGSSEVLRLADRIEVPKGIWGYSDPAHLIADAIGARDARTVLAEIGILQQTLMSRACASIARGEARVVLVTGAEAKYRALRGQIAGVEVSETEQVGVTPDTTLEPDAELWSDVESAAGLGMPVGYYAILDSALRNAQGLSVDEHRDQMAAMYHQFSRTAQANPSAWTRDEVPASFIREHSAKNKMLAFPYTKLHNSQWNVDQAAGLIFCCAELASELGIPQEKWVFPLAATESNSMSVVSARRELHRSHGFHACAEAVFELAGKQPEDIGLMELYSCFPQAVRVQLEEIGVPQDIPLSVTGAMTFAGGPLNNFVLQATVKTAQMLRADPGNTALITSVSGMNTKQACALYSGTAGSSGWQHRDVSATVAAATGLCELVADYEGEATIAGFTVLFQRDAPWRAVVVCDLPGGRRTVAYSEDRDIMAAMQEGEFCGRNVAIAGGQFL